jgi:hypothetical protein
MTENFKKIAGFSSDKKFHGGKEGTQSIKNRKVEPKSKKKLNVYGRFVNDG